MGINDLFLTPIYLVLIYFSAYYFRSKLANQYNQVYFLPALTLKLLGATFFVLVYEFYYGGGDTTAYFNATRILIDAFFEAPLTIIRLLFEPYGEFSLASQKYVSRIWLAKGPIEWFFVKVAFFFSLLGGSAFLPASLLIGYFSFLGTWRIYQMFIKIYPQLYTVLPWVIFTIPSCLFWSSGLLKDTLCLGLIGFFAYHSLQVLYHQKDIIISLIWVSICAVLLYNIKKHIIFAFLPGLALWSFLRFQKLVKNPFIKIVLGLTTSFATAGFLFLSGVELINQLENSSAFKEFQYQAKGFQGDHGRGLPGHGGGESSVYRLGSTDLSSISGVLRSLPAAIVVTLFRPYPWEAKKLITLLSSVEGMLFLLGTLYVLYKGRLFLAIQKSIANPEVVLCMSYVLILGFIVGFISYNFGVLTRFKTPLLPFYTSGLVILHHLITRQPKDAVKRTAPSKNRSSQ